MVQFLKSSHLTESGSSDPLSMSYNESFPLQKLHGGAWRNAVSGSLTGQSDSQLPHVVFHYITVSTNSYVFLLPACTASRFSTPFSQIAVCTIEQPSHPENDEHSTIAYPDGVILQELRRIFRVARRILRSELTHSAHRKPLFSDKPTTVYEAVHIHRYK